MECLSATVDARDSYTAGHSRRVQQLALAIGRELGLSQAELDLLGHAALFHDIGKLAIPDAILLKPASLTADEWDADAAPRRGGRAHHRPARLPQRRGPRDPPSPRALRRHRLSRRASQGEEIPLGARIIHVADALDSMLTTRIYRAARPACEALDELRRAAGSQFCPRCVAALERILPRRGPSTGLTQRPWRRRAVAASRRLAPLLRFASTTALPDCMRPQALIGRSRASTKVRLRRSRQASASGTPTSRSSTSSARAPSGSAALRRCASSPPTRRPTCIHRP